MSARSRPEFRGGNNIAMKLPPHVFDATVAFYKDLLGLPVLEKDDASVVIKFGAQRLWLDRADHIRRPEIWLEIIADDVGSAADYLKKKGVVRQDDVEALPEGFSGFWIANPSDVIHLVAQQSETE